MGRGAWCAAVLGAVVVFAGAAGCSPEPRSTTMHEPGIYKGARDPLLARQGQQQELVDRLNLVQRDR
jgi:hypothetical protein